MKHTVQCRAKRYILFSVLLFLYVSFIYGQTEKSVLYFYTGASSEGDPATIKITQDLFFSQLNSLDIFNVYDKRETEYSPAVIKEHASSGAVLFYAEIYEKNGEWFSKLHLVEAASGKESVLQNSYDGYYKILTEAKNSLNTLIKQFNEGNRVSEQTAVPDSGAKGVNAENISGTWFGEEHIDKIILLRGGRGFVIFKNGASMNISVTINGSSIIAVQQGKPDASFFPEIPREAALVNAPDAPPVRWELTVEGASSMKGIKSSLVAEYDQAGTLSVKQGLIPVHWHR